LTGSILLISGPSGSGKSSLCDALVKSIKNYYFSISTTTRLPRVGEEDGREYFFVSKEEFKKEIDNDNFLEWAIVHNNYYGTSKKEVLNLLRKGKLVIFDIDIQGMQQIKKSDISQYCTYVFITTKSKNELKNRLIKRNLDSIDVINKRIQTASKELSYLNMYDYCIVNDNFEDALLKLKNIVDLLPSKSSFFSKDFIDNWRV
jgi:guanylate kinase